MYQIKKNHKEDGWRPLDFPGVEIKELIVEPAVGATTVLTRLAPGAEIPRHSHTHADEFVYVLEGVFIEDDEAFAAGSCFYGAHGTPHGPHRTDEGCVVLTRFSAELDFVLE